MSGHFHSISMQRNSGCHQGLLVRNAFYGTRQNSTGVICMLTLSQNQYAVETGNQDYFKVSYIENIRFLKQNTKITLSISWVKENKKNSKKMKPTTEKQFNQRSMFIFSEVSPTRNKNNSFEKSEFLYPKQHLLTTRSMVG